MIDLFRQLDVPFAFAHWALSVSRGDVTASDVIRHGHFDLAFALGIAVFAFQDFAPFAWHGRDAYLPIGNAAEASSQQG